MSRKKTPAARGRDGLPELVCLAARPLKYSDNEPSGQSRPARPQLRAAMQFDPGGRAVVDLRVFRPFTVAQALMPTREAVVLPAELLPALIDALRNLAEG